VKARLALATICLLMLFGGGETPLDAYLKLGTRLPNGTLATLHWNAFPIRYFVTNRDVPGVTAPQLQLAIDRAFGTWSAVPNVSLSTSFAGFTLAQPVGGDGSTVIGFQDRPDLDRVLGATSFTVDTTNGDILESDIFLNSSFAWSVAANGETGRQDVESIILHESGHLLGLGHSALGETELVNGGRRVLGAASIMFPIAFTAGSVNRTLHPDDTAGLQDIYGNGQFKSSTGSITGAITKNGSGVLGAHVVAFNPATGAMIGGFTSTDDGKYTIGSLTPGTYVLRVEPLDDGDSGSFLSASANVDLNFKPTFASQLATVPRGGTARTVNIQVQAK
jgi:hypothetical protein